MTCKYEILRFSQQTEALLINIFSNVKSVSILIPSLFRLSMRYRILTMQNMMVGDNRRF